MRRYNVLLSVPERGVEVSGVGMDYVQEEEGSSRADGKSVWPEMMQQQSASGTPRRRPQLQRRGEITHTSGRSGQVNVSPGIWEMQMHESKCIVYICIASLQ